jgi:hypothetical protein
VEVKALVPEWFYEVNGHIRRFFRIAIWEFVCYDVNFFFDFVEREWC